MGPFQTFQDYLSAAIQLKSVIIKSKPERQEWEQAPPFFRCTAAANDTVLRARTGGFSIQYSTALQLKEQGNELINKDPSAALERYTAALSVFTWFDRGPDRASENIPLVCTAEHLPPSEQDQAHHLLSVCFSNAASCLLQLGMAADASYACSKALQYDPYNVKALYRRAMAHRQAGGTAAGLEAAVADLGAANQLEPANSQVRGALMAVQEELREYRRQERGMYGNMFQRGELYGDVTTTSASASTCPNVAVASRRGPGGGLAGSSAATAATAATIDSANRRDGRTSEDGDPELDPEDLLFLDPKMRKAESTLASREADLVMHKMQIALARSRSRNIAEKMMADGGGERARTRRRGGPGGGGGGGGPGRFPWWAVPWWAYVLIGLHLAYRIIKVWRIPFPSSTSTSSGLQPTQDPQAAAPAPAPAPAAAGAATRGFLEGHLEL